MATAGLSERLRRGVARGLRGIRKSAVGSGVTTGTQAATCAQPAREADPFGVRFGAPAQLEAGVACLGEAEPGGDIGYRSGVMSAHDYRSVRNPAGLIGGVVGFAGARLLSYRRSPGRRGTEGCSSPARP
jgi:hypothetical protein